MGVLRAERGVHEPGGLEGLSRGHAVVVLILKAAHAASVRGDVFEAGLKAIADA